LNRKNIPSFKNFEKFYLQILKLPVLTKALTKAEMLGLNMQISRLLHSISLFRQSAKTRLTLTNRPNCGSYNFYARVAPKVLMLARPQTAQNWNSNSFDARVKILTEMNLKL